MSYISKAVAPFKKSSSTLVDTLNTKGGALRNQQAASEDLVTVHLDLAAQEKQRAAKAQKQAAAVESAAAILEKAGVTI